MAEIELMLESPLKRMEIEAIMMVTEITEQRKSLNDILLRYNVKHPEEIERKIMEGKIAEHPSYEDYLSVLSYKRNILDLKEKLTQTTEELATL